MGVISWFIKPLITGGPHPVVVSTKLMQAGRPSRCQDTKQSAEGRTVEEPGIFVSELQQRLGVGGVGGPLPRLLVGNGW